MLGRVTKGACLEKLREDAFAVEDVAAVEAGVAAVVARGVELLDEST